VPILLVAFLGGALSDAFDRRRLVQVAELGAGLATALLVANALLAAPHVALVYVSATLAAGFYAILRPSLDAMLPRLVDTDELTAASAIGIFTSTAARLGGPALAGVLIAVAGLPVTYGLDVASFAVSLALLQAMRAMPPSPEADRPSVRAVVEGVRYARSRPELVGTYVVDIVAMLFGMPEALFPAFAERFGGAGVLGLLYAAPSAGALLATGLSGWNARVHRHGLAVLAAAAVWGAGVAVFGAATSLWLALAGLVAAGAADAVSGTFRTTIWNQTVPDRLRGRLASVELLSYTTGPLLGNVESGAVASVAGIRFSAISGGLVCIAGVGVVAVLMPAFRRYDARKRKPAE
jgi:MFS family permease